MTTKSDASYPETPDAWIERLPEDAGPQNEDGCMVCGKIDCICHVEDECEHKYAEQSVSPLGVRCIKCGHFIGAWET